MRQPSGSKIQITRQVDRLELTIPARFRPDQVAVHQLGFAGGINFLVLCLGIMTIWISIPLSNATTDVAIRIGLGVALMLVLPLTLWLLKAAWRLSFDLADQFLSQTILELDRQQLKLSQHLYRLDRGRPKYLKTREITQIIIDRYQHPDAKTPKTILLVELDQSDPIRILSTGQDLTDREIQWLAVEMSKWLNVDLINEVIKSDQF